MEGVRFTPGRDGGDGECVVNGRATEHKNVADAG